ncbi:putative DNA primase [Methylocella silvestris BL2]|uniref:Putative DNA primase n=1 Tax=Methylocella silvestris (strain DSM 15510 / CIP 108128 / LMG 27833 / NCIMB 13906 / BL2) TaxID=395965 RepID=B8ESZ6_METSB|nr:putative DNA primase [Methylocella silvestris]ACK51134.1 putative DNA primase [Methylocella silvestris BL2]
MLGDAGVPCPGCGGRDRFAVNLRKNVWYCRASGIGGDAIALAQHIDGSSFLVAVETILGELPPGLGPVEYDEAKRTRENGLASARADWRREQDGAKTEQHFRERERRAARRLWIEAAPIAGTTGEAYLKLRGVESPPGARLRFHANAQLWDRPKDQGGKIVHSGPALIAAIEGASGRFSGVQRTWIDLAQPKGKALIIHPETGEVLPSKKARGSIKGGTVLLRRPETAEFPGDRQICRRLFLGEGIETVLSVHAAMREANDPLLEGAEFRAAVDLGNLCGPAAGRVAHPTLKRADRNGVERRLLVPNNEPKDDPDFPLIPIARGITDLWLLGDADSESFFTRKAYERAAKRFSRAYPWLVIRLFMAVAGRDFNDMRLAWLRVAAEANA